MKVILDGSFIISCVRKRIDFVEELQAKGFEPIVPREVMQEMKDLLKKDKTSHENRIAINVALEMIERRSLKKMSLGTGKVDDWLIKKGNDGYHIATLDSEIKKQIPLKVVIFSSTNSLGVE